MESPSTFLQAFEKFEGLANRLPGGLQKLVLNAVVPIKDLFLKQRPPRLVLTGDLHVSHAGLFNAIFSAPVAPFEPSAVPPPGETPPPVGWQTLTHGGRGVIQLLDARPDAPGEPPPTAITRGSLAAIAPDLFLFVRDASAAAVPEDDARLAGELDALERALEFADSRHAENRPRILPLVVSHQETGSVADPALEAARVRLFAAVTARPKLAPRVAPAQAVATFMRFRMDGTFDPESDRRRHVHALVDAITAELPDEAKLEMARLSGAREAQARIANTLIKSITTASGALGLQPIPLADLPFLLAFQTMLVSGIIYISGKDLSAKLASQFLATMGANVGLGLVLREGARAAAKLVPGFGNAVSGLVAAGGTYAIGRAATAYFIEGISLPDTKKLFKRANRPDRSVFELIDRRRASKLPRSKNGNGS